MKSVSSSTSVAITGFPTAEVALIKFDSPLYANVSAQMLIFSAVSLYSTCPMASPSLVSF